MADEFTPINTQEDFDRAIASRLQREYAKGVKETEERFADYEQIKTDSTTWKEKYETANSQLDESNNKVKELEDKVKTHETSSAKMRIAHEFGIPFDMADRIKGDDEESMKADAKKIASFMKGPTSAAPLGGTETPPPKDDKEAGLMKMLNDIKNR